MSLHIIQTVLLGFSGYHLLNQAKNWSSYRIFINNGYDKSKNIYLIEGKIRPSNVVDDIDIPVIKHTKITQEEEVWFPIIINGIPFYRRGYEYFVVHNKRHIMFNQVHIGSHKNLLVDESTKLGVHNDERWCSIAKMEDYIAKNKVPITVIPHKEYYIKHKNILVGEYVKAAIKDKKVLVVGRTDLHFEYKVAKKLYNFRFARIVLNIGVIAGVIALW